MKTVYQQIMRYDQDDFEDMLGRMNLLNIFSPIVDTFSDPSVVKAVVKYIVAVYSKDSEFMLAGSTTKSNKQRAADAVKLPSNRHQQIIYLDEIDEYDKIPSIIVDVAFKYLAYQNDRNNTDLKSLYDLYDEMIRAAASKLKKGDEVDYELKHKCRKYASEILDSIKKAESDMKEESTHVQSTIDELHSKRKANIKALRPETVAGK